MPDLTCCRIESQRQGEVHVIRVEGELDQSCSPHLDLALSEAEGTEAELIVLDLERLTFIDSEALSILARASRRSATNGNRLEITSCAGRPAQVLRLTGLDEMLPITDPALLRRSAVAEGSPVSWAWVVERSNHACVTPPRRG